MNINPNIIHNLFNNLSISVLYKLGLFSLILCFSQLGFTQSNDIDDCKEEDLAYLKAYAREVTLKKEYDVAIEKASKLIKVAEKYNRDDYVFHGYNLLSATYYQLRDSIPAFEYARKALNHAQKSKNDTLIAWGYNNLATDLSTHPDTRHEALIFYKKALEIYRDIYKDSFLDPALNIAELYRNEGEYELMHIYLTEAQESYKPNQNIFDDPRVHLSSLWGDYYNGIDESDKAYAYYNSVYQHLEVNGVGQIGLSFYKRFANFLAQQEDYEMAYLIGDKYQKYFAESEAKISEETVQVAKARADAEEYRRQRNEAEFKQQLADQQLMRKNNESVLLGILITVLIIFLGYLFTSTRIRKKLINNLKQNNEALVQANATAEKSIKAKTKFFSTLSHEMRTPLYGVTGIVSLLEKSPRIKGHEEDLKSLKFSADHLLEIINDLLDISRLDEKNFKLQIRPFNIKQLMEEIVSSFDQYGGNTNNKIHLEFDKATPNYVMGDSRRISQVLLNIIGNAIKFSDKDDVWVRLKSENIGNGKYSMQFEVKDNGVGIAPEKQGLIFNEFSQVEQSQTHMHRGTGLGLPIVKKLLERMGSKIILNSKLGEGSIFSFALDLKEATLLDVMEFGTGQNESRNQEQVRIIRNSSILIVDDNKINRLVTKKVLDQRDVLTSEATSGEEALSKIQEGGIYDLILMDINMPGLNGFDTTREIRKIDAQIPIIALTASDSNFITKEVKECGMNGAIVKPYSMNEFLNTIVAHIASRKKTVSI